MFDYRKLPFIILVVGVVLFAFSGLLTVLNVTNSGIKMDMYLCEPEINSAYIKQGYTETIVDYYPREYIYDKSQNVNDICLYKQNDLQGELTLGKYENCRKTYLNETTSRYQKGECKQIGKEILKNNISDCEVFYIWGSKKLVRVSCVGGTKIQREQQIKQIKDQYK